MSAGAPVLEAVGITKRFPGVTALADVSAAFRAGEVTAVMGENGAGKSTLMKTVAGIYQPDEGEVRIDGEPVTVSSVREATARGIAFIHQELNLADNLSAAANIVLGRERRKFGPLRVLDDRAHRRIAAALFERLGLSAIDPDTPVRELSIGHQQMVEIAKALSQDARVLIMDEPTSSLTKFETDALMTVVRELRARGDVAIVFISHRIAEVQGIADRVVVLRDGKLSGELTGDQITRDRIVAMMVGRNLEIEHRESRAAHPDMALEVIDLRTRRYPDKPISFHLRKGEILGVAGLIGAGRTEALRAIFGIDRMIGGMVRVFGREVSIRTPRDAIAAGFALVPEDRKAQGIIPELMLRDNVALAALGSFAGRGGVVRDGAVDAAAEDARRELGIAAASIRQTVATLSGGNQQKVGIGKWTVIRPSIFLLDEPTRGIDIRSRGEIYRLIESMAERGAGVVVVSSDMEEILRISDRVVVMHEGTIAGELSRESLAEEAIMELATGGQAPAPLQ